MQVPLCAKPPQPETARRRVVALKLRKYCRRAGAESVSLAASSTVQFHVGPFELNRIARRGSYSS